MRRRDAVVITWIVCFILGFILGNIFKTCNAQSLSFKIKPYIPSMGFTLASGIFDGFRDASMYRMDGYGKFWNGKQSHTNKYKNGDINQGPAYFGSTSFLVWTTDFPHLSNLFYHQSTGLSMIYMPEDNNKKFGHVFIKLLAYNVIRQVGHYVVYDVIYKPKNQK